MAKHRLKKQSALGTTARTAVVVGAVSAGTIGLAAAPAAADTINVEGVGEYELPEGMSVPELPDTDFKQAVAGVPGAEHVQVPEISVQRASGSLSTGSDSGSGSGSLAPSDSAGQRALAAAESKVGSPYVWGGNGPNAFDCSGLVQWSYGQAGVDVPRTSYDQANAGTPVSLDALQPGDLVSYNGDSHTAIYAGDGQIVHATTAGQPVKYAPVNVMEASGARRL